MSSAAIQVRDVTKVFGARTVLNAINLEVRQGETLVILGGSGSGKSTLLRLMIGLVRPDTGYVLFAGEELTPENVLAVRRQMGYVIQDGGLFPHLTGQGNVRLMAAHLGWDPATIAARVRELADLTRLPPQTLTYSLASGPVGAPVGNVCCRIAADRVVDVEVGLGNMKTPCPRTMHPQCSQRGRKARKPANSS